MFVGMWGFIDSIVDPLVYEKAILRHGLSYVLHLEKPGCRLSKGLPHPIRDINSGVNPG
jgi:hypothetical protein